MKKILPFVFGGVMGLLLAYILVFILYIRVVFSKRY